MHTKNVKFRIHSVDTENGNCLVEYINPYGPVVLGLVKEEDMFEEIQVQDGVDDKGKPVIVTKRTPHPNPNGNMTLNVNIPVEVIDGEKKYIAKDKLLEFIARSAPTHVFEMEQQRLEATPTDDLADLASTEYDVDLQTPPPPTINVQEPEVPVDPRNQEAVAMARAHFKKTSRKV